MTVMNVDTMDRPYVILNRNKFVTRLHQLNPGEGFDWYDTAAGEQQSGYRAEKLKWNDSVVLLLGGYGNEVLSCCLDDETFSGEDMTGCSSSDRNQIDCLLTEFVMLRCCDPERK